MNLPQRIGILERLGQYITSEEQSWIDAKLKAEQENGWYIQSFIATAAQNIADQYLDRQKLESWVEEHELTEPSAVKKIGIVMAGNIPMAGFYDLMATFISGHHAVMKLSSKDKVLIPHLVDMITEWEPSAAAYFQFAEMLKGCDAYIATGSNNSSRYFDYYFGKFPNIIRRNRTSVAILDGRETNDQLEKLADDMFLYFGMGCRNVTKIFVPEHYDFLPLLAATKKYLFLADHHKYKNNYDYNLALHLLNKVEYMSSGVLLLVPGDSVFSPISQLNYEFYHDRTALVEQLQTNEDLQCIVGENVPFGSAQSPALTDYADGVDVLGFLSAL